jgi:hypothetical protein
MYVFIYSMSNLINLEKSTMSLTFREKSIWASLIIMSVVWVNYFVRVQPMLADSSISRVGSIGLFVGAVVTLVVLEIVVHIVLAVSNTKTADQAADERDKLINNKAGNISGWILGICVVMIGAHAMMNDVSSVLIANLLLLSLVMSQCADYALALFYYRRGW